MFVLNAYFCRELRFVGILRSKLRLLLRNTGVDSDFTQNFWVKNWRLKALDNTFIDLENLVAKLCMSDSQRFLSELIPHSFVWGQPEPRQVLRDLWRCKNISHSEIFVCHIESLSWKSSSTGGSWLCGWSFQTFAQFWMSWPPSTHQPGFTFLPLERAWAWF